MLWHFSRNKRMAEGLIRKHSYRRACHRALRDGCAVPYRRTNLPLSQAQASAGTAAPSASQETKENMHAQFAPQLPLRQPRRRHPRGGREAKPLRVFSWNAGGLSQQLWAEFKEWLQHQQELDVIFIQETHWTTSSQFQVHGWTAVSGGLPDEELVRSPPAQTPQLPGQPKHRRSAGVLTLLSPSIDSATLRWQDLHPGRAHEVHCEVRGHPVLLLNCYQYTKQRGMTEQDHYATQSKVLSSLGKSLSNLSQRTVPVLAGDFNSSLKPNPPYVGGVVPAGSSKHKPVQKQFQKFLQRNSLVALNTWQGRKANTFTSPQGSSQIDFILTSKFYAAQLARKVCVLKDFKLGAWRKGGKHTPLRTAVPLKKVWRQPFSTKTQPVVPSKQKSLLAQHVRQNTPLAKTLRDQVAQDVDKLRAQKNGEPLHPDEVNELLLEHATTFQPRDPGAGTSDAAPTAQPLWRLHNNRQTALRNLRREDDVINKMARTEHLKQAQRSLDEAAKTHALQIKNQARERTHRTLTEISEKVKRDPHAAYRSLKHVAPWSPAHRVCLRSPCGRILTESEGLAELKRHSLSIFSSHPPLASGVGQALPKLDKSSLAKGIASIKPEKAVPQGSAPASMYRLCASTVADNYCDYLEAAPLSPALTHPACEVTSCQGKSEPRHNTAPLNQAEPPSLPTTAKSADLSFIPKPSKPASKPENLRPLGIIRPDGKGIASEARRRLDPLFKKAHFASPQFAYIPGRGIADAQLRVIGHARRVRAMLRSRAPDRFCTPKRKKGKPDLIGGFTFSLDLSQAFDKTSREALLRSLITYGASPADVELVASLHREAQYNLRYGRSQDTVTSTRGIKQGCKLAPSLFSLVITEAFRLMATHIGFPPIQQFLTGFADDLVIHRDIHNWSHLYAAHDMVRLLLHYLQEAGLEVNYAKCNIMVKLAGRHAQHAKKLFKSQELRSGRKVTVWNIDAPEQPRRPILLSTSSVLPPLPSLPSFELVDSFKYLGVMVSYSNPEDLTYSLRQERAAKKKQTVRKFIHNKRRTRTASRLLVWRATVWSTATFGLESVGLSGRRARALRSWHARLRAVTHNPVHKTRETTAELFARLKLVSPIQQLHDRSAQRLDSLRKRRQAAPASEVTSCSTSTPANTSSSLLTQSGAWPSEDILTIPSTLQTAEEIVASYSKLLKEVDNDPSPDVPMHTCCGKVFRIAAGMRTHRTVKHPAPVPPPLEFSRLKHSVGGLPQCSNCQAKFKNWHNLQQHVERRVCRQAGFKLSRPEAATEADEAPPKASEVSSSQELVPSSDCRATAAPSVQLTLQIDTVPLISRMRTELLQQAGTQTFLELLTGHLGQQLTRTCLLCDSWIASTTKIAFHLTKKHGAEWDSYKASAGNNTSKMYVLTRLSPCPACGVKVESAPRHTKQCPVIQQLQLFFFLHPDAPLSRMHSSLQHTQLSHLSSPTSGAGASPSAVPTPRPNTTTSHQHESSTQATPQPTTFQQRTLQAPNPRSKQSQLQRWFRPGSASQAAQPGAGPPQPAPTDLDASPPPPPPAAQPMPQLINPHNLCYAISVLQMISALREEPSVDWSNLQPLQRELRAKPSHPVSILALESLPHCHPDWRLANRQSDALEYLTFLLANHHGSLQGTPWKRVYDADIPDSTGFSPLLLTFPEGTDPTRLSQPDSQAAPILAYSLSFFVHEWHSPHDSKAALLYTPPYIFASLPRFTNAGEKQHWRLTGLQDEIQLPAWTGPHSQSFVRYRSVSGLFHIGQEATSGHYRSFTLLPSLQVGDDSSPGFSPTSEERAQIGSGAYLLLLQRLS